MEVVSRGVAGTKRRAGDVRMIDVAVVGPDGVERRVREPLFADEGAGVDFGDFGGLMAGAGFRPSMRFSDAEDLEASGERCECGGSLEGRGFRREDPLCYRAFAVCGMCGRVAFEY